MAFKYPHRSPEAEERSIRFREQLREVAAMPLDEFATMAKHTWSNCSNLHHSPHLLRGVEVYDSVFQHVVIPELLKRIKQLSDAGAETDDLPEEPVDVFE